MRQIIVATGRSHHRERVKNTNQINFEEFNSFFILIFRSNVNVLKQPEPNDPLKPLMTAFSNATGGGSGGPPVVAPMPGMPNIPGFMPQIPQAQESGVAAGGGSGGGGGGFNLSKIAANMGFSFPGGDQGKKKIEAGGGMELTIVINNIKYY